MRVNNTLQILNGIESEKTKLLKLVHHKAARAEENETELAKERELNDILQREIVQRAKQIDDLTAAIKGTTRLHVK